MSTRIGSFIGRHLQPRLVPALVRVAAIGAWDSKGLRDDEDVEQAEILAMIAADRSAAAQPAAMPAARHVDPQHPAAA